MKHLVDPALQTIIFDCGKTLHEKYVLTKKFPAKFSKQSHSMKRKKNYNEVYLKLDMYLNMQFTSVEQIKL